MIHYTTNPDAQMHLVEGDALLSAEQVLAAACLWADTGTIALDEPATQVLVAWDAMSLGTAMRAIWVRVAEGRVCAMLAKEQHVWEAAMRVQVLGPYGVVPWSILPPHHEPQPGTWRETPPTEREVRAIAELTGAVEHDGSAAVRLAAQTIEGEYRVVEVRLTSSGIDAFPEDVGAWFAPTVDWATLAGALDPASR